MAYKGDCGKLRQALKDAGIELGIVTSIFNDRSKLTGKRKLKLWFAQNVWNAPAKHQWALHDNLHKQFGKRILAMYFIKGDPMRRTPSASFVIKLRN